MAWVSINSLTNADFIDFDILDQIIANLNYLRDAIPEIHVQRPTGAWISSAGDTTQRLVIQGGQQNVPAFTGIKDIVVKLKKPHVGAADYPVLLTASSHIDVRVFLHSQNNKQFIVRIIPTTRSSVRGLKINWQATTYEGTA